MKVIELTKGQVAIVDDEDFWELAQYRWYCNAAGYAVRKKNSRSNHIIMHREILKPRKGFEVDHINGRRTDNRRCNLREVTRSQNRCNSVKKEINCASKYKGVTRKTGAKNFEARIMIKGKQVSLGYYAKEEQAAYVYNMFVIRHYGEYAKLNKIVAPTIPLSQS